MTKYFITFYSKNKESFKNFLKVLKHSFNNQKFQFPLKYNKKNQKTTKITLLKSPHVNKSAQEQFEYTKYSITIDLNSNKIQKYLLLFKKIKYQVFPDIDLKITGICKLNNNKDKFLFNPKNYTFKIDKLNVAKQKFNYKSLKNYKKSLCCFNIKLFTKTKNYLKIFESYGNS